jgi:hypothetical protein
MAVFWDVAPCNLVEVYRRFRGSTTQKTAIFGIYQHLLKHVHNRPRQATSRTDEQKTTKSSTGKVVTNMGTCITFKMVRAVRDTTRTSARQHKIRPSARNFDAIAQTVSRCGGPDSRPGQSMWDLWWTKWHWDRFFSVFFCFPLSRSFHHCSIFTHVSSGGRTMGP